MVWFWCCGLPGVFGVVGIVGVCVLMVCGLILVFRFSDLVLF